MAASTRVTGWLDYAEGDLNDDHHGDPVGRLAAAATGILAAIVEQQASDDQVDRLDRMHTAADDALGRVLHLADQLEAEYGGAIFKPAAVTALAQRIRDAVDGATKYDADGNPNYDDEGHPLAKPHAEES